jgi:hypothetical protein
MAKTKETRPRGLLGRLRALFGATEEPVKVAPARRVENDHWVDLSLDQLLGDDPTMPVHIVTLQAYRLSLGAQWAKVEGRVMMLAESVVRRVGRHGGVVTQRDDSFLIIYKPPSQALGAKYTGEVAIELGQRLVGAKFTVGSIEEEAGPSIGFVSVTAADLLGEDGRLDPIKLTAVAKAAQAVLLGPVATTTAKASAVGTVSQTKGSKQTDAEWQKMQAKARHDTHIELVPLEPPSKKRADPVWTTITKS